MSCILNIETSTSVCSVAASQDGQTIFVKEDLKGPSHAVSLGVFVDEALSFIDSHAIPLDAVAVSCGPGSYTGLRIGVSMAKGICYGRNIPLIGIPTLEVLSVPVLLYHDLPENALLCPMIDARRMEVYAAVYDRRLQVKRTVAADIVDENSYLLLGVSERAAGLFLWKRGRQMPRTDHASERTFYRQYPSVG